MSGPGLFRGSLSDAAATRLVQCASIAAMFMSIAAFSTYFSADRTASFERADAQSRHNARLAATLVDQFVSEANSLASGLQTAARLSPQPFAEFAMQSTAWLAEVRETLGVIDGYSILDADGTAITASDERLVGRAFRFRSYFNVHLNEARSGPYLSEPIVSRGSGRRLSVASWPLHSRSGKFRGVLALSLDIQRLEALLYRIEDHAEETISIVMRSGAFVGSMNDSGAQPLPIDYREPMLTALAGATDTSGQMEVTEGQGELWGQAGRWLLASQPLQSFPGSVIVARNHETIIGPWKVRMLIGAGLLVALLVAIAGIGLLLCDVIRGRARLLAAAAEAAATDPLTGLYNRRVFDERAGAEWSRMRREGSPLALIMFDLDHFKSINDTHGHAGGDEVLKVVADRVRSIGRREDLVARTGGEEFAILLPGMDCETVERFADRLIRAVETLEISHNDRRICVTASAGICVPDLETVSVKEALRHADEALYEAKGAGRNQAILSPKGRRADGETLIAA